MHTTTNPPAHSEAVLESDHVVQAIIAGKRAELLLTQAKQAHSTTLKQQQQRHQAQQQQLHTRIVHLQQQLWMLRRDHASLQAQAQCFRTAIAEVITSLQPAIMHAHNTTVQHVAACIMRQFDATLGSMSSMVHSSLDRVQHQCASLSTRILKHLVVVGDDATIHISEATMKQLAHVVGQQLIGMHTTTDFAQLIGMHHPAHALPPPTHRHMAPTTPPCHAHPNPRTTARAGAAATHHAAAPCTHGITPGRHPTATTTATHQLGTGCTHAV